MRYFDYLSEGNKGKIFYRLPETIDKNTDINVLRYSLGGLLYIPAINKDKLYKFFSGNIEGAVSVVMCLEDSVGIAGENEAIQNIRDVLGYIRRMNIMQDKAPLIFIRPKNINQMKKFTDVLKENNDIICGIVIPKANSNIIKEYIDVLDEEGLKSIYIMPIIETTEFTKLDTKNNAFISLKEIVRKNFKRILNIRIGVTDILGFYRLRRNKMFTIYDNVIFSGFLTDLMSHLSIFNEGNMVISGGVSEYYDMKDSEIFNGYVKEIELDKMNGFIGKTVIHPNQLKICQAMSIVNFEDYIDASNILENVNGKYGVSAGIYKNRMNEINPHLKWAEKIMNLSKIYGVFNEGVDFNELLQF